MALVIVLARSALLAGARGDPARAAVAAAFLALVFHTMLYADFLEDPVTWTLLGVGIALREPQPRAHGATRGARQPAASRPPRRCARAIRPASSTRRRRRRASDERGNACLWASSASASIEGSNGGGWISRSRSISGLRRRRCAASAAEEWIVGVARRAAVNHASWASIAQPAANGGGALVVGGVGDPGQQIVEAEGQRGRRVPILAARPTRTPASSISPVGQVPHLDVLLRQRDGMEWLVESRSSSSLGGGAVESRPGPHTVVSRRARARGGRPAQRRDRGGSASAGCRGARRLRAVPAARPGGHAGAGVDHDRARRRRGAGRRQCGVRAPETTRLHPE